MLERPDSLVGHDPWSALGASLQGLAPLLPLGRSQECKPIGFEVGMRRVE